jgi:hypothetical protein
VHKAAAVNSQLLDKPVAAAVNSQPLDKAVAALNNQPLDRPAAVAVLKQVVAVDRAAVAAVVAALKLTLPRQAPGTCARFFITGAGIWACCVAKTKSI